MRYRILLASAALLAAAVPATLPAVTVYDGNGGVTITTPSLGQLLFPRLYGVQYCIDPNGVPYRLYADGHVEFDEGYEIGYAGAVQYETVIIDGRRVRQRREGGGFHNGRRIVARTESRQSALARQRQGGGGRDGNRQTDARQGGNSRSGNRQTDARQGGNGRSGNRQADARVARTQNVEAPVPGAGRQHNGQGSGQGNRQNAGLTNGPFAPQGGGGGGGGHGGGQGGRQPAAQPAAPPAPNGNQPKADKPDKKHG